MLAIRKLFYMRIDNNLRSLEEIDNKLIIMNLFSSFLVRVHKFIALYGSRLRY